MSKLDVLQLIMIRRSESRLALLPDRSGQLRVLRCLVKGASTSQVIRECIALTSTFVRCAVLMLLRSMPYRRLLVLLIETGTITSCCGLNLRFKSAPSVETGINAILMLPVVLRHCSFYVRGVGSAV